jgi:hypothetical protein
MIRNAITSPHFEQRGLSITSRNTAHPPIGKCSIGPALRKSYVLKVTDVWKRDGRPLRPRSSLSDDQNPRLSRTSFDYILTDVVTFRTFECAQIAAPWVTRFGAHKHHFSTALRADFHFGKQRGVSTRFCHEGLAFFYDRLSGARPGASVFRLQSGYAAARSRDRPYLAARAAASFR